MILSNDVADLVRVRVYLNYGDNVYYSHLLINFILVDVIVYSKSISLIFFDYLFRQVFRN